MYKSSLLLFRGDAGFFLNRNDATLLIDYRKAPLSSSAYVIGVLSKALSHSPTCRFVALKENTESRYVWEVKITPQ